MRAVDQRLDPLTDATVTVAWVIIANKPFYPVYVWYLVGNGVSPSLWTLAATPFLLTIPFLAKRSPLAARIALPVVGTLDTLFETMLFGQNSGTELFFAACIMLAAMSFRAEEVWWQRGMAAFVFVVFVASRSFVGVPLHVWSESDLATLFNLNAFAVASLTTFVALRFAGIRRQ
ncbi:hypothetical protein GGI64_004410 [Rhizobium leguminosarum]|uniref:Uncharacterized protein n=1 Tax=Rhizobium leguminosarum TaxID=384 RepID=A0A7X0DR07_RHILE|nr:hypothetical protein [Rhizobium leguminosarum]MBB5661857.1 hypothetical protein [Rhizobium leguminosarum]MBB6219881.1 hypothetical protein [Rhizobium leguminosarum]NYJ13329.1 hypothetical protein [Rhizobium leguminosarum]